MRYLSTGYQLDKRTSTPAGHPVKLRVTHNRKSRLYSTGIFLSEKDYDKVMGKNPRSKYKETKTDLEIIENKASIILEDIQDSFSFNLFKEKFYSKPSSADVISVFDEYIKELHDQGRVGTESSYNNAKQSFQKFISVNRKCQFNEVTSQWLNKYQKWMLSKGKSLTTIGIYTRSMRTIFNIAIEKKIVKAELYPFGKRRYQIPSGRNVKKALTKAEIEAIFNYNPENTAEEFAKDMWIFSYLCNGANIKDICRLKQSNLQDKTISFIRAKTERSTIKNQKNITVSRIPEINNIIQKYSTINLNPHSYVFPFLNGSETPERELAITKQVTANINKWIDRIGIKLKIEKKVTTYTARHSFATMLKRGGAPTEFISESLGHGNFKTTENYLDSFEDETKEKYASILVNFG